MGFTYFKDIKEDKNLNWSDITREERYFCSHLYHFLIGKESEFVDWLNKKLDLSLPIQIEWEVSYEVCFYRDYYKKILDQIAPKNISKRTFDLCLFSESHMLIIGAKVQQGFESGQLGFLKEDVKEVTRLLGDKVEVIPLLLCTQQHLINLDKFSDPTKLNDFKYIITWVDLFEKFKQDVFRDAEKKYKQ